MSKKQLLWIIILALLFGSILSYFANNSSMANIIDLCTDSKGNYYILELKKGNFFMITYLTKIDNKGDIIFRRALPFDTDNMLNSYKEIKVDESGYIYVALTQGRATGAIENELINIYDIDGKFVKNGFYVSYKEDHSYPLDERRLSGLQQSGKSVYIVNRKSETSIDLIKLSYDLEDGHKVIKKLRLAKPMYIANVVYTPENEIFLSTMKAEIFRVSDDKTTEKLNINNYQDKKIIPYYISSDKNSDLYFTDLISGDYYKYDVSKTALEVVYKASQLLDANKNIRFSDLRHVEAVSLNNYIGHSILSNDSYKFIANIGDKNIIIDKLNQNIIEYIKLLAICFLIIFAIFAMIVFVYNRFSYRTSLVWKQILSFIPVYLILMIGLTCILSIISASSYETRLFSNLGARVKLVSRFFDGDRFKEFDHVEGYMSEPYIKILKQISLDDEDDSLYNMMYFFDNNRLYAGMDSDIQNYMPIEYILDKDRVINYYDAIKTRSVKYGKSRDVSGEWMYALHPIFDSQNNIVGLLESGMSSQEYKALLLRSFIVIAVFILGITIIIMIYFILTIRYSLKSLTVLKKAVVSISEGKWDTTVDIKSKDEFMDIAKAFNKMSAYINKFVEDLTLLNNAYIKFVPSMLFKLIDKDNILEVSLGDKKEQELSILYIYLGQHKKASGFMSQDERFKFIDQYFAKISDLINKNSGVIQRFDGMGMMALFNKSAKDAVSTAIQIKELLKALNVENDISTVVSSGRAIVGVIGSEYNYAVTSISDQIDDLYLVNNAIERLGIKSVITEEALSRLDEKDFFNYRYIGRLKNIQKHNLIDIYELIDGTEMYEKKLKMNTKEQFEQAVNDFISGEIYEARKKFVDVIRINSKDIIATHYLFLCDKYGKEELVDWEGSMIEI